MGEASSTTTADDERVRVTVWTFSGGGAGTGHHRHEHDYVVVPVTGGTFTVTGADGSTRRLEQVAGVPYLGTAGTAHDVVSAGDAPAVFVEVELKR